MIQVIIYDWDRGWEAEPRFAGAMLQETGDTGFVWVITITSLDHLLEIAHHYGAIALVRPKESGQNWILMVTRYSRFSQR